MAPDQLGGTQVGPAADMFAWAITMVFAATGRPAFGNDTIPAVMHRILHEQPDLTPLPRPLRDLVAACLAKDPAGRLSAQHVLLTLVGQDEPPEITRDLGRRRPRWMLPAAVAAVVAAIAIAAVVLFPRDDKPVAAAVHSPSAAPTITQPHLQPAASHRAVATKPKRRPAGGRSCAPARPVYQGRLKGQFCALWGSGIPVYARPDGASPVVGRLARGGTANWFVGQAAGGRFQQKNYWNTHWAYTLSDGSAGTWGWVPIVFFRGGANGAADLTLAPCAARCHPY